MRLGALVLAAALVRAAVCGLTGLPWQNPDTPAYYAQADAILAGGWVADGFPNGYPLIVALTGALSPFGRDASLIALNVLLSAACVPAGYALARTVTGNASTALLAALLIAFWPNQIRYVRQLLSEVPATAFLTFGLALVLRGRGLAGGLCLGVACVIRTTLLPLPPLILAGFLAFGGRSAVPGRAAALTALGWALPPLLAAAYGFAVAGDGALGGYLKHNLIIAAASSGAGIDYAAADHAGRMSTLDAARVYLDDLRADPSGFVVDRLTWAWRLWGVWPAGIGDDRGLAVNLLTALRAPALALALFALVRRPDFGRLVLIAPAITVTAVQVLFFATSRFTHPAEPALLVLAAEGLVAVAVAARRPANKD